MNSEKCQLKSTLNLEFTNDHGSSVIVPHWDEDAVRNCAGCGGLKFYQSVNAQGYRVVSPCPGQFMLSNIESYNRAKIPARFMNSQFENYSLKQLDKSTAKTIQDFQKKIKNYKKGDRGFLLEGGPGTGKTHLLCASIRFLTLERGIVCRYIDYSNLLSEIRASYGQKISESSHIDPLADIPVLFIDELGKGRDKANDFEIRIIDEIINRRYLNPDLTTIFASNYRDRSTSGYDWYVSNGYNPASNAPMSSREWQKFAENYWKTAKTFASKDDFESHVRTIMGREHIEDRVSERTASRILAMAGPIYIHASDYRRRQQIDV